LYSPSTGIAGEARAVAAKVDRMARENLIVRYNGEVVKQLRTI
jgi:hypothetical protein